MGHRLSKIYTRTGDQGSTGLGDGSRCAKTDVRILAMGSVDECNSQIGLLRAMLADPASAALMDPWLSRIQHELFDLGGELSIPGYQLLAVEATLRLEQQIDQMNETLPPLKNFILPAGSLPVAQAHVCRAVCRRAERDLLQLAAQPESHLSAAAVPYLNRLSDWLFVLARSLSRQLDGQEVMWQPNPTTTTGTAHALDRPSGGTGGST